MIVAIGLVRIDAVYISFEFNLSIGKIITFCVYGAAKFIKSTGNVGYNEVFYLKVNFTM